MLKTAAKAKKHPRIIDQGLNRDISEISNKRAIESKPTVEPKCHGHFVGVTNKNAADPKVRSKPSGNRRLFRGSMDKRAHKPKRNKYKRRNIVSYGNNEDTILYLCVSSPKPNWPIAFSKRLPSACQEKKSVAINTDERPKKTRTQMDWIVMDARFGQFIFGSFNTSHSP
jgi:hypothetical protein